MTPEEKKRRASGFQACRGELIGFVTRLLLREEIAEEVVQEAAVRLYEAEKTPPTDEEIRRWLFRVATNLGLDHLRRHATWRETVLLETRERAERDAGFVAESRLLRGSPEMRAIAKEHLAVCFACTLRNLAPQESAALLLKEIHGYSVEEVADVMGARFAQVKNWIQRARQILHDRYAETCALVSQRGACHQCVELDRFFEANQGDPLPAKDLDGRLSVVREQRSAGLGPWHRQMLRLVVEVLEES